MARRRTWRLIFFLISVTAICIVYRRYSGTNSASAALLPLQKTQIQSALDSDLPPRPQVLTAPKNGPTDKPLALTGPKVPTADRYQIKPPPKLDYLETEETIKTLKTLPAEYERLIKLDVNSYRQGFPPKQAQKLIVPNAAKAAAEAAKNGPSDAKNGSLADFEKVFFDRNGDPIPSYENFAYWTRLKRVKERGWEMAARAGLKTLGMGSSGSSKIKREVYRDVKGYVSGTWTKVPEKLLFRESGIRAKPKVDPPPQQIIDIHDWGRNLTTERGSIKIWFTDEGEINASPVGSRVRSVKCQADLEAFGGEDWRVSMQGLRIVDTGAIVLASSSYK
jgi:hypothetical protein